MLIADVSFSTQPEDQTVVVGKFAFFSCSVQGTKSRPRWKIEFLNGTIITVSENRLPPQHFAKLGGLLLTDVNENFNMTKYSCFFIYVKDSSLVILHSSQGLLKVMKPPLISFELTQNSTMYIREGEETKDLISIVRTNLIPNNITVNVTLSYNDDDGEE